MKEKIKFEDDSLKSLLYELWELGELNGMCLNEHVEHDKEGSLADFEEKAAPIVRKIKALTGLWEKHAAVCAALPASTSKNALKDAEEQFSKAQKEAWDSGLMNYLFEQI